MVPCIGIDFGTTNSAVALASSAGVSQLITFPTPGTVSSTFRSVLFFTSDRRDSRRKPAPFVGPEAIEQYLAGETIGRLMQSLKTYLPSPGFYGTQVLGYTFTLEELIAFILQALRRSIENHLDFSAARITFGRPVHFSRSDGGDDGFAMQRLERAISHAGFSQEQYSFEYEPVGAAYHYERHLDHDELALIADFGGGTSDFCVIRVGPLSRQNPQRILATDGVAVAGDVFDSRLIRRVVAPHLGLGSKYRALFGDDVQDVPSWPYAKLKRWHHLSFLKSRETRRMLDEIKNRALEPERIAALIHLIEHDLGFMLYRAIEKVKMTLSAQEHAVFELQDHPVSIRQPVARADFELWIAPELQQIAECVDRVLASAGVSASAIDRVFMTGGSSLVPAVRDLFVRRFGASRLRWGDELTSVAMGLALRAVDS